MRITTPPAAARLSMILLTALVMPTTYAEEPPAPLQALRQQGATIGEAFEAPGGLTGYIITLRGRPMTVYTTENGQHAVVGTLIDGQGRNLSRRRIEAARNQPLDPSVWSRLAESTWIADGSAGAERTVYVFTDPNCPYCHGFWESARPWVQAGDVQLRHIMIGVLKPDSGPKAATLLAADNPAEALTAHERAYAEGGVTPAEDLPEDAREAVERNNALMRDLGYYATPTILYRDADGNIRHHQGQPRGKALRRVMGGPPPNT